MPGLGNLIVYVCGFRLQIARCSHNLANMDTSLHFPSNKL